MRPLPEQAVHLPFEGGRYRMAVDLVSVAGSEWFKLKTLPAGDGEETRLLATARQANAGLV